MSRILLRPMILPCVTVAVVAIAAGYYLAVRHNGPPYTHVDGTTETLSYWKFGTKPDAQQAGAEARLVHATRAAMMSITDADAARRAGWTIAPHPANLPPDGLEHWVNPRYIDDDRVLDPRRPESLVIRTGTGDLVGAMFMTYGATPEPGPSSLWHRHPIGQTVCFPVSGAGLAAEAEQETAGTTKVYPRPCPVGYQYRSDTPWMMHVWLVDTRGGPFNESMSYQGLDTSKRVP